MKKLMYVLFMLVSISLLAACHEGTGPASKSWSEEVLLHNGTTIWVERTARYEVQIGELSGTGGGNIDNLFSTIKVPDNPVAPPPPEWVFEDAVPLLLDYDEAKQTWYVVATFYSCGIWRRWERPMPPYRQYEVNNGIWEVVPLNMALVGREANLMTGVVRNKRSRVSIQDRIQHQRLSGEKYRMIVDQWDRC